MMESDTACEMSYPDDNDGSQYDDVEHLRQQGWTSLQFTEAMSVLKKFLKPRSVSCKNCQAKNPAISKPTFGWLHLVSFFISLQLEDCPCEQWLLLSYLLFNFSDVADGRLFSILSVKVPGLIGLLVLTFLVHFCGWVGLWKPGTLMNNIKNFCWYKEPSRPRANRNLIDSMTLGSEKIYVEWTP